MFGHIKTKNFLKFDIFIYFSAVFTHMTMESLKYNRTKHKKKTFYKRQKRRKVGFFFVVVCCFPIFGIVFDTENKNVCTNLYFVGKIIDSIDEQ